MVTSNTNKAREVAEFFGGILEVYHVPLDIPELRSDDVTEISRQKAQYAFDHLLTPLIVDDTSFSIDALNGFPGPYAAYVLNSIGNEGILKIMKGMKNRNAHFTTVIAFADEYGVRDFPGTIHGRIITVPAEAGGSGMTRSLRWKDGHLQNSRLQKKSRISHRASGTHSISGLVHAGIQTNEKSDTNG